MVRNLKEVLLRSNYHTEANGSTRLRITLLNLSLLAASLVMLLDLHGSIVGGYLAMAWIESISALILIVTYILFYRIDSLSYAIHIFLVVMTSLILVSFVVMGEHKEFAIFWLATLPIFIFFFLGGSLGRVYTDVILSLLVLITANSYFGWITPLYDYEFLIYIILGYGVISYLLFILEDDRRSYEYDIEKKAIEKEILLKEVNHRTKNNMQVMIGLLDMQSFAVPNSECQRVLQAHIMRLQSMSYLHSNLYNTLDGNMVDMVIYIEKIISNMQRIALHTIRLESRCISVDIEYAMDLGMIINEAISNATEHAYHKDDPSFIDIDMKHIDDICTIHIIDYGRGFDTTIQRDTLGISLMHDISNSLPQGSISIDSDDKGTRVTISFELSREL